MYRPRLAPKYLIFGLRFRSSILCAVPHKRGHLELYLAS